MSSRKTRPCSICHCWFSPDNRVGSRQHTGGRPECRQQHRRKVQARWRARNPDYFTARRLQARMVPEEPPDLLAQPGRASSLAPSAPPTSSLANSPPSPSTSRPPEALLLDRSMRGYGSGEGWLLAEMSERSGYGQEELARHFDRSISWVSRRMGLVELSPRGVAAGHDGGSCGGTREYPREALLAAIAEAARYGLYDLDRIERMIPRLVARDYFLLNNDPESEQ